MSWKEARGLNKNSLLVAIGGAYRFTLLAGQTARLTFPNFTRSVQVATDGDDVRIGFTQAGVEGANSFPVGPGGFGETLQTAVMYVHNADSASAVVSVLPVLSDIPVPDGFGELTEANGFDGGDASIALNVLEAP